MRFVVIVALVFSVSMSGLALGESRSRGTGDVARHPDSVAKREMASVRVRGRERPIVVPTPDPAVENFWSDRCVEQRRYGRSHTKDCDNPAYTGGGYPYADPYRSYAPYGGYRLGPYVPRRGGVNIDRGGLPGSPLNREWDHRPGRGGAIILR
jgi:hypothetical protein